MNEIICPNCNKVFKVDEAGFADILKQVRDHKFNEELQERLTFANREKEDAIVLAKTKFNALLEEELSKKNIEIIELKAIKERELSEQLALKTSEIAQLNSKIELAEIEV